ncbi:MAG: extracellular solute-binding protein [Lachnospiraceae bacterium]|nr:extracellular solute-binding protein [Lachnospiraceae bacterium]
MQTDVSADTSEAVTAYDNTETAGTTGLSDKEYSGERLATGYTTVSSGYRLPVYSGEDVVIKVDDSVSGEYEKLKTADTKGYEGSSSVLDLTIGDHVDMEVNVPQDGQYVISFDYFSYDESILPIEFGLMIDGEYPFYESRSLLFETSWLSPEETNYDRYGNAIVGLPEKWMRWEKKELGDASYRYSQGLKTELTAGKHVFSVNVSEGSFLLGNIILSAPRETAAAPDYYQAADGDELIVIEAEDFYLRNDSSIHAVGEYDSAISPLSATQTVLNTVDQDSFGTAGQKITYRFNVSKTGYYRLGMNYRQSEKNGFPVFTNLSIDGEILNADFRDYPLDYNTGYETVTFRNKAGEKLSVYLEAGEHTLSVEISSEPIRYALESVDRIMSGVNDLSLEVTKVAGTNKDKYRDLKLTRYIPDVQDRIYGWVDDLYDVAQKAAEYVGKDDPEDVAAFGYLLIAADQLKTLGDEPDELVYRVGELSTSVNSVNTQMANFVTLINDSNLAIDRIYVFQDGAKLPGKLNIFGSVGLSIRRFIHSFFGQSYSASNVDESHVQVWVNRPRQYVEIMQKMIDDEFTPATGIEVDLSIMTDANKLVLSNASGDTPDIATGINYAIPFELGTRGALVDLTKFEDYREVFGRYSEGMLVPSVIGDSLISLPETMNFYLLFYRKDILDKLDLKVPDTMDELIAEMPDLKMRGLNVYYPTAVMSGMRNFHGTTPLIFQHDGRLYGDTALDITVDDEEAVEGFTYLTELFTLYNMPVDVPNFYQHFRNGDLVMGIADFNSYNLILNAAPEIANSWDVALVPGTVDPDSGEVLRYMSGGAESTVMFGSNDEREQRAWEFMKWWSDADVQAEFGQTLQIMYGDEYMWPTANLEAFANLPYPTKDKQIILEQSKWILEAPRLLGSYMMEREMSNAFNDVVVNGETLRSRIDEVVKIVRRETERKLEEFGYLDSEGKVLREYTIPDVERVRKIIK